MKLSYDNNKIMFTVLWIWFMVTQHAGKYFFLYILVNVLFFIIFILKLSFLYDLIT